MQTLVLTIHILIALALIGVVLLQRSEGGGLGIGGGGGGGGGGFMTARGTANLLTRVTAILAACFFATSLILAIMAGAGRENVSIIDEVINENPAAPASGPARLGPTSGARPDEAAIQIGLAPSSSGRFTLAPSSASVSTAARCPPWPASIRRNQTVAVPGSHQISFYAEA